MRVVHVFKDYFPPTTGGIEQHMQILCSRLARHHEVTVLVPSRSRRMVEERLDGVSVVRVPEFGRYGSAPLCPTMPAWLRRLRPDLVHLHFPNPAGDLAYLAATPATPLVIAYHADIVRQQAMLPLYRPVMRVLFDRARRIIAASSQYIASSPWLSRYRDRCTVVPYGADLRALALTDEDRVRVDRLRREHQGRLVVFVGVLRYYKGVDVLVRAMAKVPGHLVVVGRGPQREQLEEQARRLGLRERVTFTGEVSASDVRVYLHAADVFALPSTDRCEAFGIAQLEAMACGTPVVSSDLPTGVRFVNQHGVTGFLVPPGDSDALADALNRLLDDPALLARYGRAARERVEREFTAERMVEGVLAIYDAVVAR